jgi:hypothetical protein
MYIVWTILALMGVGLILGSEACRWVATGLVLLANGVLIIGIATGQTAGMKIEPNTMFVSAGLSVTGWLLMLTRRPGGGQSIGGFLLVMAAHAVAIWGSPSSLW